MKLEDAIELHKERFARMLRELRSGLSIAAAAGSAGWSPARVKRWRRDANAGNSAAQGLCDQIDAAHAEGLARLEEIVATGATEDPKLAVALLKRADGLEEIAERTRRTRAERKLAEAKLERELLELEQLKRDLSSTSDGEGW